MRRAIPPHPQYAFMSWCSVKAQDQLYLLTDVNAGGVFQTSKESAGPFQESSPSLLTGIQDFSMIKYQTDQPTKRRRCS
jgi:hypothetical protein